jgi:glycosyl-4,4'-diaponeurosporenoate acyltransferase
MRVIKLLIHKEFITNLLTFFLFSIVITLLSNRMPDGLYSSRNWILREREWEKKGEIYQQILKVKLWKKFLPELSDFAKGVFPKKTIKEFSKDYLQKFLFESRKSEVTHWCIIFSAVLFYLWNDFNSASLILAIAAVLNLPYIIIQRYNRPRIMEVVESIDSHGRKLLV